MEEQERLKAKYEEESKTKDETILGLQKTILDKDDEIFELQKSNEKATKERDDWKQEAHVARKVQNESKQHKETTDFLTGFKKLQEKKGLKWDEERQTWINN